jgi:hypothetical protein
MSRDDDKKTAEISSNRIPVAGAAGLVFAVGSCLIFLLGIPRLGWFLLWSVVVGVAVAGLLWLWHKRKPVEITDLHDIL